MFLKYYRVTSDGWTDIDRCQECIERYQGAIRSLNNCELPNTFHCNICLRQPPSPRDSASHILFKCVLDLERFELTCYTTYSQYKFAVASGLVDDLRLLPPRFPQVEIRFRFHTFENKFHHHCQGEGEWHKKMEVSFLDMKSAIIVLYLMKGSIGVNIVTRGSSSLPTVRIPQIPKICLGLPFELKYLFPVQSSLERAVCNLLYHY